VRREPYSQAGFKIIADEGAVGAQGDDYSIGQRRKLRLEVIFPADRVDMEVRAR
jgi:hypothetical protein